MVKLAIPLAESMAQTYTKPGLRERIKDRVTASSKGGKPGQWSARKAQIVAMEYEDKGGGYSGGKTEKQKNLSKWEGEKWRTRDGKPAIRKGADGKTETRRYLPDKAWKALSAIEARATDDRKAASSRQYVPNTGKARMAGAMARRS
jgi:hypothetical protein